MYNVSVFVLNLLWVHAALEILPLNIVVINFRSCGYTLIQIQELLFGIMKIRKE